MKESIFAENITASNLRAFLELWSKIGGEIEEVKQDIILTWQGNYLTRKLLDLAGATYTNFLLHNLYA